MSGVPSSPLHVSPLAARRFLRHILGLDTPFPDVATAIAHHSFIQIDPINVCGRMHDLILRNRVDGYREGDLMRHLHGEATPLPAAQRTAFEHHLPDNDVLVAFTLDAWPHLHAAMHRRTRRPSAWSGKLTPRERILADHILGELAARGPLSSDQIEDDGRRARRVWGQATLAKSTLQKLFFHGRVLIARRDGVRRLYDLPERVLPATTLALPEPTAAETARWNVIIKLRQRRLALLKRTELPLVADLVQPVTITGVDCPTLYSLNEDAPLLATILDTAENSPRTAVAHADRTLPAANRSPVPAALSASRTSSPSSPLLLAPLDPLIYDRRVTTALWNFDYTWEVYTPPHKRTRGYYALPILSGTEVVGHVDPKADRERRKLTIVSRSVRRGHKVAPAITTLARWLGLK